MPLRLKAWLPVVVWMGVIFFMSTDIGSSAHTSRFIEPLLHWLIPNISDEAVEMVHHVIRKGGHLTEYAILAGLALRAFRLSLRVAPTDWSWRAAGYALLLVVAYASSDEFHQTFVPSRGASVVDVMIDTGGGTVGLAVIFAGRKIFRAARSDAAAG